MMVVLVIGLLALALGVVTAEMLSLGGRMDVERARAVRAEAGGEGAERKAFAREVRRQPGFPAAVAAGVTATVAASTAIVAFSLEWTAGAVAAGAAAAGLFVAAEMLLRHAGRAAIRAQWARFGDYFSLSKGEGRAGRLSFEDFVEGPLRRYFELAAEARGRFGLAARTIEFARGSCNGFLLERGDRPEVRAALRAAAERLLTEHFGPRDGDHGWAWDVFELRLTHHGARLKAEPL
jgi:hypothetical protein